MFKHTKYSKWYFSIIESAKGRSLDDYGEKHHIIPKCIGGDDQSDNLVMLTAREHFVCHWLLVKMHDDYRLKFALFMMSVSGSQHKRGSVNSRIYEILKKYNGVASSIRNLSRRYDAGYSVWSDPETNEEVRVYPDDDPPLGYVRGRSDVFKQRMRGKNSGKVYYHNGVDVISLPYGISPPDGYVRGNPNASDAARKANVKGKKYYHDPLTGEEGRFSSCPEGWIAGRVVRWINNGVESKQINYVVDVVPNGWILGRLKWR